MGLGLGSRVADRRCGFAYTPAFGRMEASCVRLLLAGTKSGFSRIYVSGLGPLRCG